MRICNIYVKTTRRNIDSGRLLTDLKEWERRMRLKEYFYNEEMNDFNEKRYKVEKTAHVHRIRDEINGLTRI
jgi:hypothetical protein